MSLLSKQQILKPLQCIDILVITASGNTPKPLIPDICWRAPTGYSNAETVCLLISFLANASIQLQLFNEKPVVMLITHNDMPPNKHNHNNVTSLSH